MLISVTQLWGYRISHLVRPNLVGSVPVCHHAIGPNYHGINVFLLRQGAVPGVRGRASRSVTPSHPPHPHQGRNH